MTKANEPAATAKAGSGHQPIMGQGIGVSFTGVYYVESVYVKLTVQNKKYSDMMLRDKSGARNVKYWGTIDDLESGDFVEVQAQVEDYQGNPSVIAKSVKKAAEPADLSEYIATFENLESYEERLATLVETVAKLEADAKQETCTMLIGEAFNSANAFWQRFLTAPSSEMPYYGRNGGMLVNTVTVAENALAVAERYSFSGMEKALLLTAALLHRFGAADAYEFEHCMPKVTKKGMLLGVDNLTFNRISTLVRKIAADAKANSKTISQETVLRVMHAVTSHAGSQVKPMTREAIVLAAVSNADVNVVESFNFIATDLNATEEFTAYDPRAGRKYYRG
jgi:23S rRNA maturation-related 3'-5' exoribonuclease YhaM